MKRLGLTSKYFLKILAREKQPSLKKFYKINTWKAANDFFRFCGTGGGGASILVFDSPKLNFSRK
jgi:hypothetical protein